MHAVYVQPKGINNHSYELNWLNKQSGIDCQTIMMKLNNFSMYRVLLSNNVLAIYKMLPTHNTYKVAIQCIATYIAMSGQCIS